MLSTLHDYLSYEERSGERGRRRLRCIQAIRSAQHSAVSCGLASLTCYITFNMYNGSLTESLLSKSQYSVRKPKGKYQSAQEHAPGMFQAISMGVACAVHAYHQQYTAAVSA